MKYDLLIVPKGSKEKVINAMEEIDRGVKEITGKEYAVREMKPVPEPKKQLAKGEGKDGTPV